MKPQSFLNLLLSFTMAQAFVNRDNSVSVSRGIQLRPQPLLRSQKDRAIVFESASEVVEVLKSMLDKLEGEGEIFGDEINRKIKCACKYIQFCIKMKRYVNANL